MAYSSSLLLDSQQPLNLGDDDADFGMIGGAEELPDSAADEALEQPQDLKRSALAKHLNPALGAAATLLPHLRWLCACCGIPTAASDDDELRQAGASASGAVRNTPGDANSALTAVANLEEGILKDQPPNVSMAPALTLLFKGEYTSTAASTPPSAAFSLTQASSSSASSGIAVSVPGVLLILRTLIAQARWIPCVWR